MRKIINQTTTRVFKDGRWYDKTDIDSIEVPDPTPAPAPVRTLRTNTPTCTHCHQAQTACRCRTPQPHAQAQDVEDWMPRTILHSQGKEGKETQPAVMSAETRARQTAYEQWESLYHTCRIHPSCHVPNAELMACSTQQLVALSGQLQAGKVIKEWRDETLAAWTPPGLLGAHRP